MAARWYTIHVYSGFEKKVAQSIEEQARQKGMEEIVQVLVPMEEIYEMRRGTKVSSERKFFPGYVLVQMELTDESWHLVKDTPKVTGFLGARGRPTPISDAKPPASSIRWRRAWTVPVCRSLSRSAIRCGSATVRSRRSTAWSRKSTRNARGSRFRFRFSAGRRRSNWSTRKSRSSELKEFRCMVRRVRCGRPAMAEPRPLVHRGI